MLLPEITAYLAGQSLGLTEATNLFYAVKPTGDDIPDAIVVVYEYPGLPNEPVLGGTTVNIEFPSIQVMCRGTRDNYVTPRALLQSVIASLTKIGEQTLSGTKYHAVQCHIPPSTLRQDANQRFELVASFRVVKDPS